MTTPSSDNQNPKMYFSLSGEVDSSMYKQLLDELSSRINYANERILIYLNTEGGDFYQGLAMYDLIRRFNDNHCPVDILCNGPVMSSGMIMLQAARERISLPNSQFMIHYGEDTNKSEDNLRHNSDMLKLFKQIVGERTNVSKRVLNGWFAKDVFWKPNEALKCGLIDKVLQHGKEN